MKGNNSSVPHFNYDAYNTKLLMIPYAIGLLLIFYAFFSFLGPDILTKNGFGSSRVVNVAAPTFPGEGAREISIDEAADLIDTGQVQVLYIGDAGWGAGLPPRGVLNWLETSSGRFAIVTGLASSSTFPTDALVNRALSFNASNKPAHVSVKVGRPSWGTLR